MSCISRKAAGCGLAGTSILLHAVHLHCSYNAEHVGVIVLIVHIHLSLFVWAKPFAMSVVKPRCEKSLPFYPPVCHPSLLPNREGLDLEIAIKLQSWNWKGSNRNRIILPSKAMFWTTKANVVNLSGVLPSFQCPSCIVSHILQMLWDQDKFHLTQTALPSSSDV